MNFIDKQQGSQTERLQDFLRFGLRELQNNNALKLLVRDKVSGEGLRELQNNKALKLKCEDKSSYRHTVVLFML